jgi:hypothetical protein
VPPIVIEAHGIGGRADLPVPLWIALYGAGAAVLVSFFVLFLFWNEPRTRRTEDSHPLARRFQRVADSRGTLAALRAVGLLVAAVELSVAWFGPRDSSVNAASTWFYVWFWVGLGPLSVLFGPFWRWLNPLRTIAAALRFVLRRGARTRALPEKLGYWPAAVSLLAFLWLELVYDHADVPHTVFAFLVGYGLVHVVAGTVYGPAWFDKGDGFEVYSSLFGQMAPIGRRPDGRVALRNPLDGLAAVPAAPGLVVTISVMLGSTGFDGFSRGNWWRNEMYSADRSVKLIAGSAGLLAAVALVYATYGWASNVTQRFAPPGASSLRELLAPSLLPISLGYSIAHYFSFAMYQGQAGVYLANDPYGRGWNLFGLTSWHSIDYSVVTTGTIAAVQIGAIVCGHVAGVVAAHDRSVGTLAVRHRRVGQYPLLTTMVAYTMAGIALVLRA